MLEWYEAYASYEDAMVRMETLLERVALATLGTTRVAFRGHEVDLKARWRRIRLADALAEHGLWLRDADELRTALSERGVARAPTRAPPPSIATTSAAVERRDNETRDVDSSLRTLRPSAARLRRLRSRA